MSKKSTKLEAFRNVLLDNNISAETIEKNDELIEAIKKNAETIEDYRHPSYVRHLLSDIVMLTFFAILSNANEWGEIESFGKQKEKWLRKYLELPNGIPTDDTIRLVISNINTDHFFELTVHLLIETMEKMITLGGKEETVYEKEILSVDGKESRGSKRLDGIDGPVKALQTLNVYSGDYGMCIGQKFIREKTNEIPAAQEILPLLDLSGSVVTADAMNCQKETVEAVWKGKGDYVLALKGNQPLFYQEVVSYFEAEDVREKIKKKANCWHKTVEKEHGGIAVREYYITGDVDWYNEKKKWKKLNAFGMVRKTLEKGNGEKVKETRYYICSIGEDVELFERAARGHWGIETRLHWQMDFTFQDDKNRSMAKTGAKNLQIMKKLVLAILGLVKTSYKLSMKRIRYEISLNYEQEVEKIFSMINADNIKGLLKSKATSEK